MKKEFVIRKCLKCGAIIEVMEDCMCENCGITCCGEQMSVLEANSVECAIEKHLPEYEIIGNYVEVKVNHVMEDEHYIDWIGIDAENLNAKKYLKIGETPKAIFPYIKGSRIYAHCNKHGLWETVVE